MEKNPAAIHKYVEYKINSLLGREESYIRATLAKLRRGIGRQPGSMPDIWDFTLDNLPKEYISQYDKPTAGEWAAHMSLTLFALHQQGNDIKQNRMSEAERSLGSAVRQLVNKRGVVSEDAIKRRFDTVVTSDSPEELAYHLRGLINLMKSEKIPLDYPQLAEELLKFQNPDRRDSVRLRWGQDYYFNKGKDEEKNEQ